MISGIAYFRSLSLGIFLISTLAGNSCRSGDGERQEQITKLRVLGVRPEKPVLEPATSGKLKFYIALPLEAKLSYELWQDSGSLYSVPIRNLILDEGSADYKSYSSLQIFSIEASFSAPEASNLGFKGVAEDVARLRYSLKFKSAGEEEKVVGDILIRPSGSGELDFHNPSVEILSPDSYSLNSELILDGSVENPNDEKLRIGWFTSGGEIKNRRALESKWKTNGDGAQTLILTARGVESRGFGIAVKDY